jgi:hypothetical protein
MEIRKRYIVLALVPLAMAWLLQNQALKYYSNHNDNAGLQRLREIPRLTLWQQNFMLNNIETQSKHLAYLDNVVASGKLAFHIDLSSTTKTDIKYDDGLFTIKAPLQISYVMLDEVTVGQISQGALSTHIDPAEAIKQLSRAALSQETASAIVNINTTTIPVQEVQLGRLTGKKVKIILTEIPKATDWPTN